MKTSFKIFLGLLLLSSSWRVFAHDRPCNGAPGSAHPNGGGFVADSASVEKTVYVGPLASVCDRATISDKASIYGQAIVFGDANISDQVRVLGNARVFGKATVSGKATVFGEAKIFGKATVTDRSWVVDEALVYGSATVDGRSFISMNARVFGRATVSDAKVSNTAQVYGTARILEGAQIRGRARVCRGEWSNEITNDRCEHRTFFSSNVIFDGPRDNSAPFSEFPSPSNDNRYSARGIAR